MEMIKPAVFGVMANGKRIDLLETLKETKITGHAAWETSYTIKRPRAPYS